MNLLGGVLVFMLVTPAFPQASYRGQCRWEKGGCEVVQKGLVAFIGQPLESFPGTAYPSLVRFRILEPLEGLGSEIRSMEVAISDEVKANHQYVIFARREGLRYAELREICDSVIPIEDAADSLSLFRRRKTEPLRAAVTVFARDRNNEPLAGVQFRLSGKDLILDATSAQNGFTKFESVEPGAWTLELADQRYDFEDIANQMNLPSITLAAAACPTIYTRLSGRKAIRGRLIDFSGRPVPAGVQVRRPSEPANTPDRGVQWSGTSENGDFEIRGLSDECYHLFAYQLGRGAPKEVPYAGSPLQSISKCVTPDAVESIKFQLPDFGATRLVTIRPFNSVGLAAGPFQIREADLSNAGALSGLFGQTGEDASEGKSWRTSETITLELYSKLRYRFYLQDGGLESDRIEIEPGESNLELTVSMSQKKPPAF